MQKEDKNYYISLTREIKNDKTLPSLAKLLYGDICTLASTAFALPPTSILLKNIASVVEQ